jgi:hypothetical protein
MRLYIPEDQNLKILLLLLLLVVVVVVVVVVIVVVVVVVVVVMYLVAQQVNTAATSVAFGTYVVRIQTEISCHANSPRPALLLKGKYKNSSRLLHCSSL